MSFAKKFIEEGDYEKAIDAATTSIADGDAGPEPLFDRATAYDLAERYADAVADFESAITKNGKEQEIDPFTIDDSYFSSLLSASRQAAAKDGNVPNWFSSANFDEPSRRTLTVNRYFSMIE